jgi:transposase
VCRCSRARSQPGVCREKKSLPAAEQQRSAIERARRRLQAKLGRLPPRDLVFVEESGARTDRTRRYGRAPKGERVPEAVPHGRGKGLTILGALTTKGVPASRTVEAATEADVFLPFIQPVLVPTWRPGQVVVRDNLSAHKQRQVRRLLKARRCRLWYLPPYSPDFNPRELAWSKRKTFLRGAKARLGPVLEQAVGEGLRTITAKEARNWFRHCRSAL